jgi:predicted transcriptional regulator
MSHDKARPHSDVRLSISHGLVQEYGIPLAEVARHVGVCTSAVSKMLGKAII